MNYPQQGYPQQGYPPQQQPAYPPQAQPPYPPAPPQQGYPQYPVQPPQPPQYPQQGYYQPQGHAQPQAPVRRGTLADVINQPASGEGKSIAAWLHSQLGQVFTGTVARTITDRDSSLVDRPRRDGREEWKLTLPFLTSMAAFPEGRAIWVVKGADLARLNQAMTDAGVPLTENSDGAGGTVMGRVPEEGAQITIRYSGQTPMNFAPGMNPRNDHEIYYQRPAYANGGQFPRVPANVTPLIQPQAQQQGMPPSHYTGNPQDNQTMPGVTTQPIPPGYPATPPQPQYMPSASGQYMVPFHSPDQQNQPPQPQDTPPPVVPPGPPQPQGQIQPQPPAPVAPQVPPVPPQVPQPQAPQGPPQGGMPPMPLPDAMPQTPESAVNLARVLSRPVVLAGMAYNPDGSSFPAQG